MLCVPVLLSATPRKQRVDSKLNARIGSSDTGNLDEIGSSIRISDLVEMLLDLLEKYASGLVRLYP